MLRRVGKTRTLLLVGTRQRRRYLAVASVLGVLISACGQYHGVHQQALGQAGSGTGSGLGTGQSPGPSTGATSSSRIDGTSGGAFGSTTPGSGTVSQSAPATSGPYLGEIGVTSKDITIGFIYPRSGPYQALATNFEPAIDAAFDEINDAGGVYGRHLIATFGDDGYNDASLALASVKAMSNRVFGLSTITFNAFAAVHDFMAQKGIPYLYYNADRGAAARIRNGFPVTTFVQTQAELLPQFMITKFAAAHKKIGIIYQDTPDLKPAVLAFEAKAQEAGLNVVIAQPISETPATCVNEVQNVKNSLAQVVWLAVAPIPVPCILRDAKSISYQPIWTATGNGWTVNVVNTASGCQTNGIITMSSSHPIDSPPGRHYAAMIKKYFPNNPNAGDDDLAYLTWALARYWGEAMRRAGPFPTRSTFISGMEAMKAWNGGVFAPLSFGPGDRLGSKAVLTIQVQNCRWREIDSTWRERF